MKMRHLLVIISLIALPLAAFSQDYYGELFDGEDAAVLRSHVEYLSSLDGRGAGSEGEKAAADYFRSQLLLSGVDVLDSPDDSDFGLLSASGDTLTSHNAIGYIEGYDPALRDHYIVIGARLDNLGVISATVDGQRVTRIFPGANGNASGLALLLDLAKKLQTNKVLLRRSVIIAAFGGSELQNAGSWYFLNRSFKDASKIDAMINLDMLGTGSRGFYAYCASNADMEQVVNNLSSTLQPVHPAIVRKEPCRSDHRSFYAKEIPAVMFTSGMYPEYNTERDVPGILEYDFLEREGEYIYNYALALVNGPKPDFMPSDALERTSSGSGVVAWNDCDVKPAFMNNYDPNVFLNRWVYVYLKYPQYAVENGIQGRVLVDFVIDEKGKMKDVKVLKGVHPSLDAEAVKVVEASPDWKPARVRGQKVKCEMSLYVEFRLEKRK